MPENLWTLSLPKCWIEEQFWLKLSISNDVAFASLNDVTLNLNLDSSVLLSKAWFALSFLLEASNQEHLKLLIAETTIWTSPFYHPSGRAWHWHQSCLWGHGQMAISSSVGRKDLCGTLPCVPLATGWLVDVNSTWLPGRYWINIHQISSD